MEDDAGELSGEAREDLEHLVQSASEAREFLARLGAWNAADRLADPQGVDLGSIVRSIETPVTVESSGEFPVVQADPEGVKRVLTELVSNAQVHGRPPIHVRATPSGFQVEDDGEGVDDSELAMEPLSRRHVHEGAGFGLAIAKRTADAMGAKLTLEPKVEGAASPGLIARVEW